MKPFELPHLAFSSPTQIAVAGVLQIHAANLLETARCVEAGSEFIGERLIVNKAICAGRANRLLVETLSIELRAPFRLCREVIPHMRPGSAIVNIGSTWGIVGGMNGGAYCTVKAGLIGLVKTLGKDYAETGITVNALAPAVIRTPMVAALPQATIDYMTAKIPMRRCGELDEAAQMIAWIVSPACGFTTGFTFDLSGGRATY